MQINKKKIATVCANQGNLFINKRKVQMEKLYKLFILLHVAHKINQAFALVLLHRRCKQSPTQSYLPSTRHQQLIFVPSTHYIYIKNLLVGHGSVTYFSWFSLKFHLQIDFVLIKKQYKSLTFWAKTNPCEKARWRPTVLLLRDNFFKVKKVQFSFQNIT